MHGLMHMARKNRCLRMRLRLHLYGHVAGAARAFNISPLYWKKYRKGQMTTRQAYSAIARLFNDEWWTHQLKGQRSAGMNGVTDCCRGGE